MFLPPLVVFCIGVFGLMMLSLLETILVMHLMAKDNESQDNKADNDQSLTGDCNQGNAAGGDFSWTTEGGFYTCGGQIIRCEKKAWFEKEKSTLFSNLS